MEQDKIKIISLFFLFIIISIITVISLDTLDEGLEDDRRPNIVMISLDTLRADHMSCIEYDRNVSPFICDYGEENIIFESTYSQAPWTLPSQTSTFTSRYPSVHKTTLRNRKVENDSTTLAEVLGRNGYSTAAFVTGKSTEGDISRTTGHYLPKYGLDKGFSEYNVRGMYINNTFSSGLNWLSRRDDDKPFFLFLQGYDIHQYGANDTQNRFRDNTTGFFKNQFSPFVIEKVNGSWAYNPDWVNESKNISGEDLDQLKDVYDANTYRTDNDLRRLFKHLKERDEYDNTIVVIYSPHGTNLNDRVVNGERITGHSSLRDYNLHVPLIMRLPGEESREIEEKVELIDVMPTLISLSGSETEVQMQGESLENLIGGSSGGRDYVYSEYGDRYSIRGDKWRLTKYASGKNILTNLTSGNEVEEPTEIKEYERLLEQLKSWKISNLKYN